MGNDIIRPISGDGLLGFDTYGQLWATWYPDGGDTKHATIVPDMRGKTCAICGKGWLVEAEEFLNQIHLDTIEDFAHKTCFVGHQMLTEATMWYGMLCARISQECKIPWTWKKIPNEYRGAWNTPWYLIEFKGYVPKLKLGSRKRVWHMSLHDVTRQQKEKLEELFQPVTDTKWFTTSPEGCGVHAWTEEQARKYLDLFAWALKMDRPVDREPGCIITDMELPPKEEPTAPAA